MIFCSQKYYFFLKLTHDEPKVFLFPEILILWRKLTWLIEWPLTALDSDQDWNHLLYFYLILIYKIHKIQIEKCHFLQVKEIWKTFCSNEKSPDTAGFIVRCWRLVWRLKLHLEEFYKFKKSFQRNNQTSSTVFFLSFIINACFYKWFWLSGSKISVLDQI